MSITTREILLKARAEIETRLMANPDYIALKALDATIANLGDASAVMQVKSVDKATPTQRYVKRQSEKGLSYAEAAEKVIKETGEPQTTAVLVDLIKQQGVSVGGADPIINLASSLSRDGRLMTVRLHGKSHWWLSGIPVPGEHSNEAMEKDNPFALKV